MDSVSLGRTKAGRHVSPISDYFHQDNSKAEAVDHVDGISENLRTLSQNKTKTLGDLF